MTSLTTEPDPRSISAGHEVRDVNIRGILALAVSTAVGVVLVMGGLWILLRSADAQARKGDPRVSPLATHQPPPPPRLQDAPIRDYEAYQAEQEATLNSYGWVDRQQEVVRIPVDLAMDLYLEHVEPPTLDRPTVKSGSSPAEPSSAQEQP